MKKHVRIFLGVFVVSLLAGYIGLLSDNAELEAELRKRETKVAKGGDNG